MVEHHTYAEVVKKQRVRAITHRAIAAGKLVRPEACEKCGKACKPDAAHVDYDKPLEIEWLCRSCHRRKDVALKTPITLSEEDYLATGLVPITIYLPDGLIESLKARAAREYESVSGIIRRQLLRPEVSGGDQGSNR